MKLWPKSLFGRLLLMLWGVIFLLQVVNTSALWYIRKYTLLEHDLEHVAALVVQTSYSTDESARQPEGQNMWGMGITNIRWTKEPLTPSGNSDLDDEFKSIMQKYLAESHGVSGQTSRVSLSQRKATMQDHPRLGCDCSGIHYNLPLGTVIQGSVSLPIGDEWLNMDLHRDLPPNTPLWPMVVLLLMQGLVAVALVLVITRVLLKPLRLLAAGAQGFARQPGQPRLLPVNGPEEVRQATSAFNAMQERISAYMAEKGRILASLSHDLRTPLTRLRLRLERFAQRPEDAGFYADAQRDVAELEELIETSYDVAQSGDPKEQVILLDVNSLLETLVYDREDAGYTVSLTGRAAPLPARRQSLRRCLDNLVGNALRYGGAAHITVLDSPTELRIQVADPGPGIPDELLEQVFEPFYRVDSSRCKHTGGSGLGLSIARNLAQLHGGSICLSNITNNELHFMAELCIPRNVNKVL